MINDFCKGDRVRLTARYIAAMHCKAAVDWPHRTGSVVRAKASRVIVLWDGRKSVEEFDPRVVEKLL